MLITQLLQKRVIASLLDKNILQDDKKYFKKPECNDNVQLAIVFSQRECSNMAINYYTADEYNEIKYLSW